MPLPLGEYLLTLQRETAAYNEARLLAEAAMTRQVDSAITLLGDLARLHPKHQGAIFLVVGLLNASRRVDE